MDISVVSLFTSLVLLLTIMGKYCDSAEDSSKMTRTKVDVNGSFSETDVVLSFNPTDALNVEMDSTETSHLNYTLSCDTQRVSYVMHFKSAKPSVASLPGRTSFYIKCTFHDGTPKAASNTSESYPVFVDGNLNISVFGELLGRTKLEIEVVQLVANISTDPFSDYPDTHHHSVNTTNRYFYEYPVLVRREQKPINTAFQVIITVFLVFSSIAMGCKTDLRVVVADLKKPIAPAIGLFCQYIVMPMIAFTIASTVPFEDPIMSFGIFALGCSPGGGSSNVYTYLIDGDVSLSVTMTTVSSFLSLGLFPMWILTVGQHFLPEENDIEIPFLNVFISILAVVLPLGIGIAIGFKAPKLAKGILKYSKPVLMIVLIAVAVLMLIANLYMWRLFTPTTILAGSCLPYFGYLLGGIIAWITRNPWKRIKTIALETGLQNMGIAIITILFSLPTPDSEIAMVCPAASGMMSSFLVGTVVAVYLIQKKCKEKFYKKVLTEETNDTEERNNKSHKLDEHKSVGEICDNTRLTDIRNDV